MSKKYTVTSALPYANGPLHIGHIAGAYLPADIYVRYRKAKGDDVLFVCGSDEHGAAITLRAKKDGVSPQEIVDKYHAINKILRRSWNKILISIIEHHQNYIMKLLLKYFKNLEEKRCLHKKYQNSFLTKNINNF